MMTSTTPATILIVSSEFPPAIGGVGTYAYEVARGFHERGRRVRVLAANDTQETRTFDARQPFPIERMPEPRWMPARQLARLPYVRRAVAYHEVSAILATEWRAGLWAGLFARRYSKPFVVTAHGSEILKAQSRPYHKWVAWTVYSWSQCVMADSRYARDLVMALGVPDKRIQVIPLGAHAASGPTTTTHALALKHKWNLEGQRILVTVARLVRRKGHDVVLRALPSILRVCPDVTYVIVGEGDQRTALESLAHDLGVAAHVRLTGSVSDDDRDDLLAACDVYIQPSRPDRTMVEGFGLSLIDAMAHGKAVIATRHGGILDIIQHGQNGLLVNVDDADELGRAVLEVLHTPDLARSLGERARCTVTQVFNWSRVIDNIEAILEGSEKAQ